MKKSSKSRKLHINAKGVVTYAALGLLATAGILVALAVAPGLGMVLKMIDPNPRKAGEKLERALRALVGNGDVEVEGEGKDKRYRITDAGKQRLARYKFMDYEMSEHGVWDKKLRIVCFDIPETEKYIRQLLQRKLSYLGFYRLQNSVFVYPYPCQEIVALAHEAFGLHKHVRYAVVEKFDDERMLMNFFKLAR